MRGLKFIFCLLAFYSCTRKANIKLPEPVPRLVVTCFLSPDEENITAVVRSSTPKFGSGSTYLPPSGSDITDATVVISDGSNQVQLIYDVYGYYRYPASSLPIVPGKTYYLTVRTPDGKEAYAITTVPGKLPNLVEFNVRKSTGPFDSDGFSYDCLVADEPGETTYLELYVRSLMLAEPSPMNPNPIDTAYSEFNVPAFQSDEGNPHVQYSFQGDLGYFTMEKVKESWADVALLNCNRDFYLYNKTAYEGSLSGGDPFANPTLVYTNINNGFGCFGAYIGLRFRKPVK